MTLLVVYPLGWGLNALAVPGLAMVPAPLRSFAVSVAMILLMTYVIMPRVTRLFSAWLYPAATPPSAIRSPAPEA